MREDPQQNYMLSYLPPEKRVRKDHPLRAIRAMWTKCTQLSRRFDTMYASAGRPSSDDHSPSTGLGWRPGASPKSFQQTAKAGASAG